MRIEDIRVLLALGELPVISGGSVETEPDQASADGADAGGAGSDEGSFELDGESYTKEQLAEALEAWRNRDEWETTYKQRDQNLARTRDFLEHVMGKKLKEISDDDLNDLRAFGVINYRLRNDPKFAKAWETALVAANKAEGATDQEARAAAKEQVQEAREVELPDEVMDRLDRVDVIEQWAIDEQLGKLERSIDGQIYRAIGQQAKDVARDTPGVGDFIRRHVLTNLTSYENPELIDMANDGSLAREITGLVRSAVKIVAALRDGSTAEKAEAMRKIKAGSPVPMKGNTAAEPAREEPGPVQGKGLRHMHDRLFAALTALGGERQP